MQYLRKHLKRNRFQRLRHVLRTVRRDESGVSAILVAGAMVFMLSVGTLAVDAGMMMMRDRKLQNAADVAAMAAGHDMNRAEAIITQSLQDNGYGADVIQSIEPGNYDPSQPPATRFTPAASGNAIRLTLSEPVDLFFMPTVSDTETVTVGAQSIVTNVDEGAFSATTGLANLQDGVLNSLLTETLGTSISLTAVDYQGLLQTDVQAISFLEALATQVGVSAGTYNDLLAANATLGDIVNAMTSVLNAQGALDGNGTTALAALETLAVHAAALDLVTLSLSDLFDFGTLGLREIGSGGRVTDITAGIVAFDLLFQSLYSGKAGEIIDLGLALNVPLVANIHVAMAVGEPLIGDPSNPEARIVIGPVGSRIHTAPVRLQISVNLLTLASLPGLGYQAISVPIYAEVAGGDAEITGISCGATPGSDSLLTLLGSSGAADIFVGQVSSSTPMQNFSDPVTVQDATLLWIPLVVRLRAAAQVTIDGAGPSSVSFTGPEMAVPTTKRIGSTLALESTFSTLISTLSIDVDRGILAITSGLLGITDAVLIQPVLNLLASVTSALDPVIAVLFRTLGLHAGYMDLTGYGARCGAPALVG